MKQYFRGRVRCSGCESFGGINYLQFMCLLDICIQICFYKKSQPQAESQLFSNSVVLFYIRGEGTVVLLLRRWGEPKGLALPVLLLQESGRSGGVPKTSSCCNPEVAALMRIFWVAGSRSRIWGVVSDVLWPRGRCLFCLLEHPGAASVMMEVNKCGDKLGNSSDWCEEVESTFCCGLSSAGRALCLQKKSPPVVLFLWHIAGHICAGITEEDFQNRWKALHRPYDDHLFLGAFCGKCCIAFLWCLYSTPQSPSHRAHPDKRKKSTIFCLLNKHWFLWTVFFTK